MLGEIELVVDAKAILGEGPCWDERRNILYWVDIEGKKLNLYDCLKKENKDIQVDKQITSIVPLKEKETKAIVTLEDGFYFFDFLTEEFQFIADPERHLPTNRFNDGKCDEAGRFWAGTMSTTNKKGQGALYCLEKDGTLLKKLDQVSTSNGLAWSKDKEYLYYIDTPTKKVSRFTYHLETGELLNREEVIDFTNEKGYPDGMTIDKEGMLWIAHWGGGRVSHWNPNTGDKIEEIVLPAINVTSCTFGGERLTDLYITTARSGMSDEQLKNYPLAGGLFKVKVKVGGEKTDFY